MKKIVKTIYNFLPFKKHIFTAMKTVWRPRPSIYQHLHFKDVFTVAVANSKKFKVKHFGLWIENEIFWRGLTGGWEKESLKLWIRLCEKAETIIDIGANTGVYSLVAKTVNPGSKVYSFEPHPMYFKMLGENVTLNNFDIVPLQKAISNHDGIITIGDYAGGSSALTVEALTLDTFVTTNGIKRIDLIKIDVETHEPLVLEGFSHYISEFKPTILIEILDKDIADKVHGFVGNLGYLYFNIDEKGSIRQTDRIEKSDYYNYLLCKRNVAAELGLLNGS